MTQDGRVEAIRLLLVARSSAVKARSQAINQLKALLVSTPAELREQPRTLNNTKLIATCARRTPSGPEHPLSEIAYVFAGALAPSNRSWQPVRHKRRPEAGTTNQVKPSTPANEIVQATAAAAVA